MHFKIAVVLCALYFVTMTQSVGVNRDQVTVIVDLVKASETEEDKLTPGEFQEKLVELGVSNVVGWIYREGTTDGFKTQSLLVYLAKDNKTGDKWTTTNLSSQEVIVYLSLFTYHDEQGFLGDGLLNPDELKSCMAALRLSDDDQRFIAWIFKGDETVNFSEFLFGILAAKEKGIEGFNRGLNMYQIDYLSSFIQQKTNDDYIPTRIITQIVQGLPIIKGQHKEWNFQFFQKWPLEMKELVVLISEYNTTTSRNTFAIPVDGVRDFLGIFATHDKDNDGFLVENEFDYCLIDIVRKHFPGDNVASIRKPAEIAAGGKINVLQFFTMILMKCDEYEPRTGLSSS